MDAQRAGTETVDHVEDRVRLDDIGKRRGQQFDRREQSRQERQRDQQEREEGAGMIPFRRPQPDQDAGERQHQRPADGERQQ